MPDIEPDSVDPERLGQKFLWIRARFGGVNLSCGMAGETDLTAIEVREVIRRLEAALNAS